MLTISHISKKYGRKQVLCDVSFELMPGECVSVIGENGCGKTTLLKIIAGIMKPTGGSILLDENASLSERRAKIGYVPQDNPLFPEVSVWDNLWIWGAGKSKHTQQIMEQFELSEIKQRRVEQLSEGMKRRLSIACACLKKTSVMILDEPTTALDVYYKEEIRKWIRQYLSTGGSVIMTSHDEGDILLANRCYLMQDGILHPFSDEEKTVEHIRNAIYLSHNR